MEASGVVKWPMIWLLAEVLIELYVYGILPREHVFIHCMVTPLPYVVWHYMAISLSPAHVMPPYGKEHIETPSFIVHSLDRILQGLEYSYRWAFTHVKWPYSCRALCLLQWQIRRVGRLWSYDTCLVTWSRTMRSYSRRTHESRLFSRGKYSNLSPCNVIHLFDLVWWKTHRFGFVGLRDPCVGRRTGNMYSSINWTLIIDQRNAIERKYSRLGQCGFHSQNLGHWFGQMSANLRR